MELSLLGEGAEFFLSSGFCLTFIPTPNNFSPKENAFLTEDRKNLKDICDTLRSVKAEKEVELKKQAPDALNYRVGPHPRCPFKCLMCQSTE